MRFVAADRRQRRTPSKLSQLYKPCLFGLVPLQQFGRGFVVRVLRNQFAAYGQIEDEAAQALHGVGRVHDRIEVGEQTVRGHRVSAPASIAFNRSRTVAASASAAVNSASKVSGSPWSSSRVCGFLTSRL